MSDNVCGCLLADTRFSPPWSPSSSSVISSASLSVMSSSFPSSISKSRDLSASGCSSELVGCSQHKSYLAHWVLKQAYPSSSDWIEPRDDSTYPISCIPARVQNVQNFDIASVVLSLLALGDAM